MTIVRNWKLFVLDLLVQVNVIDTGDIRGELDRLRAKKFSCSLKPTSLVLFLL